MLAEGDSVHARISSLAFVIAKLIMTGLQGAAPKHQLKWTAGAQHSPQAKDAAFPWRICESMVQNVSISLCNRTDNFRVAAILGQSDQESKCGWHADAGKAYRLVQILWQSRQTDYRLMRD